MFERFTDRARRVLVLAQEEARLLNHSFIGTEHILLGLIAEGEGVAARALQQLDISLEDVRDRVEEVIGLSGSFPTGSPPFTPRAKKVLEFSLREALELSHNYIGTEHMLLGLVREGEGVAAQVLVSLGADLERVRRTVVQLLSGYSGDPVTGGVIGEPVTGASLFSEAGASLVACSFCGRRPPDSGQLVSGTNAFICEHCVEHWAQSFGKSPPNRVVQTQFISVRPTGPPPDDEEAAKAEIAAAFSTFAERGDDAASLPMVERGENLGEFLASAEARFVPQGSVVIVEVADIAFLDRERAHVWFAIRASDTPLVQRRGDAVLVDGEWKMARSTFCELMALAGVECPPPPQ